MTRYLMIAVVAVVLSAFSSLGPAVAQSLECCALCEYSIKANHAYPVYDPAWPPGNCCREDGTEYDPPCQDGDWFCPTMAILAVTNGAAQCIDPRPDGMYMVVPKGGKFQYWLIVSECSTEDWVDDIFYKCDSWATTDDPFEVDTDTCGWCLA